MPKRDIGQESLDRIDEIKTRKAGKKKLRTRTLKKLLKSSDTLQKPEKSQI